MNKVLLLTAVLFAAWNLFSADVVGYWKTIDDETNEAKSIVRIYEHEGKIYGRVVKLFKNPDATAKLPDNPKIVGLDILWNLKRNRKSSNSKCTGGKVLDPQKGKVYTAQIWLEDNGKKLVMRGSLFGIGRSQTWLATDPLADGKDKLTPVIPKLK